MLQTTEGIVLHHFKYAEKSIIAKIYTKKFGTQSYIINGIRSKKSKHKIAYLQPLSVVEINVIHKEKKSLHQLKDIRLVFPFKNIPFNIFKSSISFFVADVLVQSIKEEEANEDLFQYLTSAVQILDLKEEDYTNFHLVFLAQLTRHLGLCPQDHDLDQSSTFYFDLQEGIFTNTFPNHQLHVSAPISTRFLQVFGTNFDTLSDLKLNNEQRKYLLSIFLDFFRLHLSNFGTLKSQEVLEEVLN